MANYLIPSQVIVSFEKEHLIYFKMYIMLNQPHFRGNNNATPRQLRFNKSINVLIIILNDESVR